MYIVWGKVEGHGKANLFTLRLSQFSLNVRNKGRSIFNVPTNKITVYNWELTGFGMHGGFERKWTPLRSYVYHLLGKEKVRAMVRLEHNLKNSTTVQNIFHIMNQLSHWNDQNILNARCRWYEFWATIYVFSRCYSDSSVYISCITVLSSFGGRDTGKHGVKLHWAAVILRRTITWR